MLPPRRPLPSACSVVSGGTGGAPGEGGDRGRAARRWEGVDEAWSDKFNDPRSRLTAPRGRVWGRAAFSAPAPQGGTRLISWAAVFARTWFRRVRVVKPETRVLRETTTTITVSAAIPRPKK